MDDKYISHVLDSKYKGVGYRMEDFNHLGLIKEKTKSGYFKIIPIIYSEMWE